MEAGSVVPTVSRPGRDGEPHVRVCQPGCRARRTGGRNSPAVRHSPFPTSPQVGDAQLWPCRAPAGLQNRRAHRQGYDNIAFFSSFLFLRYFWPFLTLF